MMQDFVFPTTAGKLAGLLNAEIIGDFDAPVQQLSKLEDASRGALSFYSEKKYSAIFRTLEGAVILTEKNLIPSESKATFLLVKEPKKTFAEIAKYFNPRPPWKGISPLANIDSTAVIGKNVIIGPFAIVSENAVIGSNTIIFPHAYIGEGVEVGEACEIHPHVTLLTHVKLGNKVRVFSGSVLGSEGFGFIQENSNQEMPQVGWVIVEDDVRIGAQCTVDRSTIGNTLIESGVRLDDHVHIGHNSRVGKNSILCGHVALAGSSILEENVILGGQVGIAGHATIGAGARVGGQSGTSSNLKGGESYFGYPAMPIRDWLKIFKVVKKLPELFERLKKLEEKA